MKWYKLILTLTLLALTATGCSTAKNTPVPSPTRRPTWTPLASLPTRTPTPLPIVPTSTPEPLAARVDQGTITLEDFNAQLARYQQSGTNLATQNGMSDQQFVLHEMIDELLLAESAEQAGFVLSDGDLDARISSLAAQVNLDEWLAANLYTADQFRIALRRSLAAAWMRDQIAAQVPTQAEQIHLRQILLYNLDDANTVYGYLQNGQDFMTLAKRFDPTTGGELGWIVRGAIPDQALEDAAFNLQPGGYSQIIETAVGYHILYLVEREAQRELEPEARRILQTEALKSWVETRRQTSQIEIFVP